MKDHDIRKQAETASWASAIVSSSGLARRVALVIDERIELESGEMLEFDSVSFHLVDSLTNLQAWGDHVIDHYNQFLPRYVLPRILNRVVDLGFANAHTFQKISGQDPETEFCCSGCGLKVAGRMVNNPFSPHDFYVPGSPSDRSRLREPCQEEASVTLAC